MPLDTIGPLQDDIMGAAKERLNFGSAPKWAVPCPVRPDFKPKQPGHLTHLLKDWQIEAEHRLTFVHEAVRLETIQAVQRQSQWRLEFDPRRQSVAIHSVKIRRDGQEIEQAEPAKFHLAL